MPEWPWWSILLLVFGALFLLCSVAGFAWIFAEASLLVRLRDCPKYKRDRMILGMCKGIGMSVEEDASDPAVCGEEKL
jgi:hypothetical protein